MVGLLAITGSTSLIGVWMYRRWGDNNQVRREHGSEPTWWQAAWQRVQARVWPSSHPIASPTPPITTPASVADLPFTSPRQSTDPHTTLRYGLRTSALALAVTTTGRLCYPPLQVAGLPLLIYMGIPAAQQAYDQLGEEGGAGRALAETVVLAVCLVSGAYWVGALGFWLYYGGRTLLTEKQPAEDAQPPQWLAPTTTHLWKDGAACAVPTTTLQPGDQVILHSGELAPMDGLITEGVAWLRPQALLPTASSLRKGIGDKIAATDLVLVGRICVRVSQPHTSAQ